MLFISRVRNGKCDISLCDCGGRRSLNFEFLLDEVRKGVMLKSLIIDSLDGLDQFLLHNGFESRERSDCR